MAKMPLEVKEFIIDAIQKDNSEYIVDAYRKVCTSVYKKFGYELTLQQFNTIRKAPYNDSGKKSPELEKLNEDIPEIHKYKVINEHYHFTQKGILYKLPVEEIDRMFYDFSKHGGNLTGEQMLSKYELKPEVWHMIKNRLRLYKDSNTISPYTAENTPEDILEEIVTEASARHIDTLKHKMISTHEILFKKESKRAIKTLANAEYFFENLESYIEGYKPRDIKFTKPIKSDVTPITIAMSDFHFGKKGTQDIVDRMNSILSYILPSQTGEVLILSLGDLGEAFVEGGMHPGQSEGMELHGYELMLFIANVFETFLEKIYLSGKKVRFIGIGGNHDRLGKTHGDDMARTGALVTYELIRRGLSNSDIDFDICREKINVVDFHDNRFILAHGDDGFSNKKPEDILWKNGDNTKHNIIIHGDKHNCTIKETKNATMIGLPALAGAGEYDKRLDLHSEPGFVVIYPNNQGSVDILLKRL